MSKKRPKILLYKFFTIFTWPFALITLTVRMLLGKEINHRALERFAYSDKCRKPGIKYIWLHAASLGEMKVAVQLMDALSLDEKKYSYILTTQTKSSAMVFAALNIKNCTHHFLPFDIMPVATLFIKKWQPSLIIFFESEIWPLYLSATLTPKLLLNARISENSYKRWKIFPKLAQRVFNKFKMICASSDEDGKRFKALNRHTQVYGNIKLCAKPLKFDKGDQVKLNKWRQGNKVITFASISADEVKGVTDVISQLVDSKCRFVVIPRHPGDASEIKKLFHRYQIAADLRTNTKEPITQVYIANTFNELGLFYSISHVVYVGGSMCGKGGQNMLEPLKFNVPTVVGLDTRNFSGIMRILRSNDIICEVNSYAALKTTIRNLLSKKTEHSQITGKIKEFNQSNQGVLDRYVKLIKQRLQAK